jgi:hypothetical protein
VHVVRRICGGGMASATINLRVQPYRLLNKANAAYYCGRSVKTFEAQCPVTPIRMPNGDFLWDVQELDKWIDSLKVGTGFDTDDIVTRLA